MRELDSLDDESRARLVGESLKHRLRSKKQTAAKQNIAHRGPLQADIGSIAKKRSDEGYLEACLDMLKQLPSSSRYAQHRRQVVEKAIELLRTDRWVSVLCTGQLFCGRMLLGAAAGCNRARSNKVSLPLRPLLQGGSQQGAAGAAGNAAGPAQAGAPLAHASSLRT